MDLLLHRQSASGQHGQVNFYLLLMMLSTRKDHDTPLIRITSPWQLDGPPNVLFRKVREGGDVLYIWDEIIRKANEWVDQTYKQEDRWLMANWGDRIYIFHSFIFVRFIHHIFNNIMINDLLKKNHVILLHHSLLENSFISFIHLFSAVAVAAADDDDDVDGRGMHCCCRNSLFHGMVTGFIKCLFFYFIFHFHKAFQLIIMYLWTHRSDKKKRIKKFHLYYFR